jgi:2',3'-cyclic-nucleotide 2'-phosphodiesterase/3'-nucleotidase
VDFDTEAEYGEEAGTIRNMTIKYLKEEKNGQYEGKTQQRWALSGLESRYNEQREIVKSLINDETISIPTSDDGRYTNIASINVKELMFKSDEAKQTAITTREKKLAQATEQESKQIKREITLIKALN